MSQPASTSPSRRRWPVWASLVLIVLAAWAGQRLLQGWSNHRVGAPMREAAKVGDIRLISSEDCRYCRLARTWLTNQRVPFSECIVERDAQCQADYERTGARGTPTVLVRGQVQLGFVPKNVLSALQR